MASMGRCALLKAMRNSRLPARFLRARQFHLHSPDPQVKMPKGKHFINNVKDPVERALRGLLVCNPNLRLIAAEKVLYHQPTTQSDKVLLLSGGGSGHEPAHAGYLGHGMLDIAVCGNIFASPSAAQVSAGLRALQAPKGTLMIVKNYTGDKLNFGLAAEKAKLDGRKVDVVFVCDDVSVDGNELVGQRGLAGVVFVHKIAGALASRGANLTEVSTVAAKAARRLATVAVSLDKASVPQKGKQEILPADEVEFGMGIHNEPGARRTKLRSLESTVESLLDTLSKPRPSGYYVRSEDRIAVMVNNLGGLSVLEMSVIYDEVLRQLHGRGLQISRSLVGTFVTSLDGPGFSVTALKVDEELESLLDAPTTAPAWPRSISVPDFSQLEAGEPLERERTISPSKLSSLSVDGALVARVVNAIARTTREDEPQITAYDTIAGDGDCGETLLNGVNALVSNLEYAQASRIDIAFVFKQTASIAERSMGGTSGAIYAIFLNAVAASLARMEPSADETVPTYLAKALQSGLKELSKYTAARKGHRTLMDALIPFVEELNASGDLERAYAKTYEAAQSTKQMEAQLGRASYVSKKVFEDQGGVPDPGALGVVSIVRGVKLGLASS